MSLRYLQAQYILVDDFAVLLGGQHKEGRIRGSGHDPTYLKNRKGEGRIAADVVLNIGI